MPGRANEIGGGRTSIAGGFLRVRATPTQMLVQDVLFDRVEQAGVDRPLIVSHEMIGRMLLKNLLALPIEDSLLTTQPHTVVRRVDPGMGRFTDLLPE